MENRTYYYARVSTKEQNLDRQLNAFRQLGATDRDIVTDKESGKNLDRSGYQALKTTILRQGDTLVIKSLDRLSRNKGDIKSASFANEQYRNQQRKAIQRRNCYQKVIICLAVTSAPNLCLLRRNFCAAGGVLFSYSGAIFERSKVSFH